MITRNPFFSFASVNLMVGTVMAPIDTADTVAINAAVDSLVAAERVMGTSPGDWVHTSILDASA
jgi:hypothetical protein